MRKFADRDSHGFIDDAAAVFADANSAAESSWDVSDPTFGTLTIAPESVRGSLTSQLRVSDVERFAPVNVMNNRLRIQSQILATIRRTSCRHSHRILYRDVGVIVRTICAPNLSSWLLKITRPPRANSHTVLGDVNALRCASTVRSARPAGVDAACAPLEPCICAMVEV